jgi:hypothetical protein
MIFRLPESRHLWHLKEYFKSFNDSMALSGPSPLLIGNCHRPSFVIQHSQFSISYRPLFKARSPVRQPTDGFSTAPLF